VVSIELVKDDTIILKLNRMKNSNLNIVPATQLLRNSIDRFLAKDMKGWTDLCDEDVSLSFLLLLKVHRQGLKAVKRFLNICATTQVLSM